ALEQLYDIHIPWWIFTLAAIGYVVILAYIGISQSLVAALGLLAAELLLLIALALYMLIVGPGEGAELGMDPFLPGSTGMAGVGLAMSFGILSHVGIEEGATLGLEVRDPRKGVPQGLWIAAIIVPIFYLFVGYAMTYGYGF